MGSGTGGWTLLLLCTTCGVKDEYRGVLLPLAADAAEREGWTVDRDALHSAPEDRYATCPVH